MSHATVCLKGTEKNEVEWTWNALFKKERFSECGISTRITRVLRSELVMNVFCVCVCVCVCVWRESLLECFDVKIVYADKLCPPPTPHLPV